MRMMHLVSPTIFSILGLCTISSADLSITSVPNSAPDGFSQHFSKYIDVLGIPVYATSTCGNARVRHCANVLAQYLDNNEDGQIDNPAVHTKLINNNASMILFRNENEEENSDYWQDIDDEFLDYAMALFNFEINQDWQQDGNQKFDATLEETLHLVTWAGYAHAFPTVFGEFTGTQIANAMDANIANGHYHYDDPTCNYACNITEYTYWSLTSILGAQSAAWRQTQINDEWELPTRQLVESQDSIVFELLTNPQWALPTVLPNGSYSPVEDLSCLADLNEDGSVGIMDFNLFLVDYGCSGKSCIGDLNDDASTNISDFAILLIRWGTDGCS
jgi:hypothetical protein